MWLVSRRSSDNAGAVAAPTGVGAAIVGAALLLLAGCGGQQPASGDQPMAAGPTPSAASSGMDPADARPGSAEAGTGAADLGANADDTPSSANATLPSGILPVRIEIPAIGVDADVVDLDLRGPEPEVPTDFAQAGWYTQTRRPGEIGPSVIAGHIDSVRGPAVFAHLDELEAGDEITIHETDGVVRTFVVTGAGQYPKEALPGEVFGFDQPVPELRLITCGGSFDRSIGHYRDNHVVYTELAAAP